MLAAAGLLLATHGATEPVYEQPTHDEMRARIELCGFEQVAVVYEESLQSDVVSIEDSEATDEQLLCAAKAVDLTFYIAEFAPDLTGRFYELREELARPRAVAASKAYFAERSDFGQLPERASEESDIEFARRVEKFCGPQAIGVFTDEFGGIGISQTWMGEILKEGPTSEVFEFYAETLGCLMHASTLTDLEFGFVGNERFLEDADSQTVAKEGNESAGTE